ncbi:hypothetical protein D3C78_1245390 [compost metagenome]
MRGANIHQRQQRQRKFRFRLPHVQHGTQFFAFLQCLQQRSIVHHRTATGVDQNAIVRQRRQQFRVHQMQRVVRAGLIQWRMESEHVGFRHQLFQRPKLTGITAFSPRRIA